VHAEAPVGRALAALLAVACADPDGGIGVSDPVLVVPSAGLPAEAAPMNANNNLDVVRHDGRVYLAFRTGATHFAGEEVQLLVVSSTDERTWRFETRVALGTDVREPRFLAWNGKLLLYFAVLGSNPLAFEPQGFRVIERGAGGSWSSPEAVYLPGFIPWRARVEAGQPYLVVYVGGENLYNGERGDVEVHLLTTDDGQSFRPAAGDAPVVQVGGGSETDFVLLDDGSLIAVVRNERGDALGWGSKICRAAAGALGTWACVGDPRKFDSPLLFRRGRDVYLIARRNLGNEAGHYDLMLRDLSDEEQTLQYLAAYSGSRKRCSLWRVDPDRLAVTFVLDLPSRGDTCFPAILDGGGDEVVVYNYSTPLDATGDDLPWLAAQLRRTNIYRTVVRW
jgi:hypothetical protein